MNNVMRCTKPVIRRWNLEYGNLFAFEGDKVWLDFWGGESVKGRIVKIKKKTLVIKLRKGKIKKIRFSDLHSFIVIDYCKKSRRILKQWKDD